MENKIEDFLNRNHALGFGIIEFEKDVGKNLNDILKSFKVQTAPLYGGRVNDNNRYEIVVLAMLPDEWIINNDEINKKTIISKKKEENNDGSQKM